MFHLLLPPAEKPANPLIRAQQTFIGRFSSELCFLVLRVCLLSFMWGDRSRLVVEMCETNKCLLSCLQAPPQQWNAFSQQISPSLPPLQVAALVSSGAEYTLSICFYFLTAKSVCAPSHFKSNKMKRGNFPECFGAVWGICWDLKPGLRLVVDQQNLEGIIAVFIAKQICV